MPNEVIDGGGNSCIGGRLAHFVSAWKNLTSDKFILDIVRGLRIKFDSSVVRYVRPPLKFNKDEDLIMKSEIQKLIAKGVIVPSQHEQGEVISNVFLRKKKDGKKYRMILNLKPLNEFIEYQHFKMDSFETAKHMILPGCYMASVDLSDAYFSVAIHKSHRKFMKFLYNGTLYEFIGMPQGLACAPRIFTKLLKPFYAEMGSKGHVCMGYIDDSLIIGCTYQNCLDSVTIMSHKLEELGFVLNKEKSIMKPVQSIEFLGYIFDSVQMNIALPASKVARITQLCQNLLKSDKCTIQTLSEVVGTMNAYCNAVEYGRIHCRNLEILKNEGLKQNSGSFEASVTLSDACRSDCQWWIDNAHKYKRSIDHGNPSIILYTDASTGGDNSVGGWGAKRGALTTGGQWSYEESHNNINVLEMFACYFGLKSLCKHDRRCHIQIMCDNTCAISYVNNMGGTKSLECNAIAQKIWKWAIETENWISVTYVPSADNEADESSRSFHDTTEWKLNEAVFQSICEILGHPDIDLFASRLNNQIDKYVSWGPDPSSFHVDAFSMEWANALFYIFPPFSLLMRVAQKIARDVTEAIVVFPNWRAQPWYVPLMNQLVEVPLVLPMMDRLLRLPYAPRKRHPLQIQLIACRLSGDPSKHADFLRRQSILSSNLGEVALKDNMTVILRSGLNIAQENTLIPFSRL